MAWQINTLCENKWTLYHKEKNLPLVIQKACDTNVLEHTPFELAFWDQ